MTHAEVGAAQTPLEPSAAFLEFIGAQTFVVDPVHQGYGLGNHDLFDGYANKFFILTNEQGWFASPREIPGDLLNYYSELDLAVAASHNIITNESREEGRSLADRLNDHPDAQAALAHRRGSFIVPFMMTPNTEAFAVAHDLTPLVSAAATEALADKVALQESLLPIADAITKHTGFDITIPTATFKAGDRRTALAWQYELSQNGQRDTVAIKPKSAAGLGIFVVRAENGLSGLENILNSHFRDDEPVLLEPFVEHNHSPSMQGVSLGGSYRHLFFNRQIISVQGERIVYNGNQIPFGPATVTISPQDLARVQAVHEAVGETFIRERDIRAVAGFDVLMRVSRDGAVHDLKLTEANLHLPSCLALYAATAKLFPDGFEGIAHNLSISLQPGQTPASFLDSYRDQLVAKKHTYGIFPLNLSFADKADVVLFARNAEHLGQLLVEAGS